ncbi:MAG: hypothetical protein M3235_07650, partial [Actinomycetota bacterium]|nr:hypothetical protein [Actinomycetota bacterium]
MHDVVAERSSGTGGSEAPPGMVNDPFAGAQRAEHGSGRASTERRGTSEHAGTGRPRGPPPARDSVAAREPSTSVGEAGAQRAPERATRGGAPDPTRNDPTRNDSTRNDSTQLGRTAGGEETRTGRNADQEAAPGTTGATREAGDTTGESGPHATTRADGTTSTHTDRLVPEGMRRLDTAEQQSKQYEAEREFGPDADRALQGERRADDSPAKLDALSGRVDRGETSLREAYTEGAGLVARGVRDVLLGGKAFRRGQMISTIALTRDGFVEFISGGGKSVVKAAAAVLRARLGHERVAVVAHEPGKVTDLMPELRELGEHYGLTVRQLPGNLTRSAEGLARVERAFAEADILLGTDDAFKFAKLLLDGGRGGHYRQPDHFMVDEVDYVLLDRAGVDARLSKQDPDGWVPTDETTGAAALADELRPVTRENPSGDYRFAAGAAKLTQEGIARIRQRTGVDLDADPAMRGWVENTLFSRHRVLDGVHYVRRVVEEHGDSGPTVHEGVLIVDEASGYAMPDQRWHGGRHETTEYAAFGAEGVRRPTTTVARISIRELIGDSSVSGVTGSLGGADDLAAFRRLYGADTKLVHVRPDLERVADDYQGDYRTAAERDAVAFRLVQHAYAHRNPVWTRHESVAATEAMSVRLTRAGIPHNLLTAKDASARDRIVADAGREGAVTVSTNMMARGTDIKLGGDPQRVTDQLMREEYPGLTRADPEYAAARAAVQRRATRQVEAEKAALQARGGLRTIGVGASSSVRAEMQLRARSGRQGERGTTYSLRSLEDRVLQHPDQVELVIPETGRGHTDTAAGMPSALRGTDAELAAGLFEMAGTRAAADAVPASAARGA